MNSLDHIPEPTIRFGNNQEAIDPRDGLALFGPNEYFSEYEIQAGVVGTATGIGLYSDFVECLPGSIKSGSIARPTFPGFKAVFNVSWPKTPAIVRQIDHADLAKALDIENSAERVYRTVSIYLDAIKESLLKSETRADLWFVVVPRELWLRCRPFSPSSGLLLPRSAARDKMQGQGFLFERLDDEYGLAIEILQLGPSFHDQLKARILAEHIDLPIQIMVEPTLRFESKEKNAPYSPEMKAHLAWTQSTSLYYKLGKLPWKLSMVRAGVCYVGLVFKKHHVAESGRFACSAAQLFLDSGDGTIFRGNNGPW